MTDYSRVYEVFAMLLGDGESAEDYSAFVENAVSCIIPTLKDEKYIEDERVATLCACSAYYKLRLAEATGAGYVASFKAGDVSYTADTSVLDNAERLLSMAEKQCSELVTDGGFSFRAV